MMNSLQCTGALKDREEWKTFTELPWQCVPRNAATKQIVDLLSGFQKNRNVILTNKEYPIVQLPWVSYSVLERRKKVNLNFELKYTCS